MTTIFLARHGETDWNREKRWQGFADLSLNEHGRGQAHALAEALEPIPLGAVYASDLRRARETALEVARPRGLDVTPIRDLREIDVGSWTGLTYDEVKERFPDEYARLRARSGRGWDGGETYAEMGKRVLDAVRRIAADHPAAAVLIVTHSGPIRAVRAHAVGLDYATDRTAAPTVERAVVCAVTVVNGVFGLADTPVDPSLVSGER